MRYTTPLFLFLILATAAATAQTIAPTGPSAECAAITAPSAVMLEPWLAGSAWTEALRFYQKGRYEKADAAFSEKFRMLASDLTGAFGTSACNYDKVNGVLDRRVFKAPPDVIPMDEEFGLPLPVAMAAADSACRAGSNSRAAGWLRPAAISGNIEALAALVVLLSPTNPGTALAMLRTSTVAASIELALAGCVASIRAGHPEHAWCTRTEETCDTRQGLALQELVRMIRDAPARADGGRK